MEILVFLSIMTYSLHVQRLNENLAKCALGFFLAGSAQTLYTNFVYPRTQESNRLLLN